jgi:hypothetical protein
MHIQNFFLYFIFLSNKDHKGSFPSHLLSSPMSCLDLGSPLPSFMFVVSSLFPITCLDTSLSTNQFEVSEYWHRFSYNTFIVKVLVLFRASLQSWKLSTSSSLPPWSCLLSSLSAHIRHCDIWFHLTTSHNFTSSDLDFHKSCNFLRIW